MATFPQFHITVTTVKDGEISVEFIPLSELITEQITDDLTQKEADKA